MWNTGYARPGGANKLLRDLWIWRTWRAKPTTPPWRAGETVVRAAHVRSALASKVERHNLIETRVREMIEEGTLLVDVTGERVGQVNGLSVLELAAIPLASRFA